LFKFISEQFFLIRRFAANLLLCIYVGVRVCVFIHVYMCMFAETPQSTLTQTSVDYIYNLPLDLTVQNCTSGNVFPPSIPVFRRVECILPGIHTCIQTQETDQLDSTKRTRNQKMNACKQTIILFTYIMFEKNKLNNF